jgi:alpha,alpha-trehalase
MSDKMPPRPQRKSSDLDPYLPAASYYGTESNHTTRNPTRTYTYSSSLPSGAYRFINSDGVTELPSRRGSHDETNLGPRRFLVEVDTTLEHLRKQEDTDNNYQITIEDRGPKVFALRTAPSNGLHRHDVRGTYMTSNLLQELCLAKKFNRKQIVLDESRLNENPVNRLSRLIKDAFWDGLTRRIDASSIEIAGKDPKDWTDDPRPRIYVPVGAPEQYEYYTQVAADRPDLRLEVLWLPAVITPEAVRDMNSKPGLLALAM